MTVPQKCDVCLTPHHKHQAHVFSRVVPALSTSEGVEASLRGAAKKIGFAVTRPCPVCGLVFAPKRADAKTCSAKCRQAASRKRRA